MDRLGKGNKSPPQPDIPICLGWPSRRLFHGFWETLPSMTCARLAGTLGVCCLLLGAQTHASAQAAANDAAAEGARQFAVTCAGCHGAGKQYLAVTAGDDVIAFALR